MSISSSEAKQIAEMIIPIFDTHPEKYDFKKYPADAYARYKASYSSHSTSNPEIHDSLAWKWGHHGQSNFSEAKKLLAKKTISLWPDFVTQNRQTAPENTFKWWQTNLPKTAYITAPYISHLIHHQESLPIIDQHNFRAMNSLIKQVRSDHKIKKQPSTWRDILELKCFVSELLKAIPNRSIDELDHFLMMYGKSIKLRRSKKKRAM
jgi:hypothetical protein